MLIRRFDADAVLDLIEEHRATSILGLPLSFSELAACQRSSPRNIASVRRCVTGGDAASTAIEQAVLEAIGQPLFSFWTSTEDVAGMLTGVKPGPISRPLPYTEVRVVDERGEPVANGDNGEMWVRSPGTTPGYWNGPDEIHPLPDGWFKTGDWMRHDAEGQLRYMGRSSDVIVRAGSNISPVEVEETLRRQLRIADAAVAGVPDDKLGEKVGAALVLEEGSTADNLTAILEGASREIAEYKLPETVAFVDAIPHNAMTKLDRKAVAKTLADRGETVRTDHRDH